MLLLLISYIFICFTCYYIGKPVSRKLNLDFSNPLLHVTTGIITITTAARIWSFFLNTGILFQILIFLCACFSAYSSRSSTQPGILIKGVLKKNAVLFAVASLFILFFCSQQSISYDEALYHASFIEWLNQYGTVKGLANLHGRLAFNSSWHLFSSIFNWRSFSGQPLNQINGFFCLWILLYFLTERELHPDNNAIRTFTGLAIVFLFFPLITVYHLIDPSADYVIIFWTLLILYEVYFYTDKGSNSSIISFICISSLYLFTVKLSSFILLACFLLYLKELKKQPIKIKSVLLIFLFIVVPYIVANYLMSGYIIYPYLDVHLLNPVWKVDALNAQKEIIGIKYSPFERWAQTDAATLATMNLSTRYKLFFAGIRLPEKLIFITAFLAAVFNTAYAFMPKADSNRKYAVLISFSGFMLIMLSAPDVRFAAGYIFFSYIILLLPVFKKTRLPGIAITVLCILSATTSAVLYHHLKKTAPTHITSQGYQSGINFNMLIPEQYALTTNRDSTVIDGTTFYLFDESKGAFHWNTIPAMYSPAKNIQLLDSTDIRAGFRIR